MPSRRHLLRIATATTAALAAGCPKAPLGRQPVSTADVLAQTGLSQAMLVDWLRDAPTATRLLRTHALRVDTRTHSPHKRPVAATHRSRSLTVVRQHLGRDGLRFDVSNHLPAADSSASEPLTGLTATAAAGSAPAPPSLDALLAGVAVARATAGDTAVDLVADHQDTLVLVVADGRISSSWRRSRLGWLELTHPSGRRLRLPLPQAANLTSDLSSWEIETRASVDWLNQEPVQPAPGPLRVGLRAGRAGDVVLHWAKHLIASNAQAGQQRAPSGWVLEAAAATTHDDLAVPTRPVPIIEDGVQIAIPDEAGHRFAHSPHQPPRTHPAGLHLASSSAPAVELHTLCDAVVDHLAEPAIALGGGRLLLTVGQGRSASGDSIAGTQLVIDVPVAIAHAHHLGDTAARDTTVARPVHHADLVLDATVLGGPHA